MKLRSILFVIAVVVAGMLSYWGCGSSLEPHKSFEKLKPIEALPEPTPAHNLVVQIKNVADVGTSHKNRAELWINDKRIKQAKAVYESQHDYDYYLRLEPGVYKVKASYYARKRMDWQEYKLTTADEKVRVYPNRRTILTITLDKKLDGHLKSKINMFKETYVPLSAAVESAGDNQVHSIEFVNEDDVSPQIQPRNKIALQVTTTPVKAKVYVDSKYAGQSPLTVFVDRLRNHVVQISRSGFQDVVKYINQRQLENQNSFQLFEKLKARR